MSHSGNKAARRAGRALTLQLLFEIDVAQHDPVRVLNDHLPEAEIDPPTEAFVRGMVSGVLAHLEGLDEVISQIAPEWPVSQMSPVDRNILRMAIFELRHQAQTPLRVAINEAVELARLFGSESARRFVNGALGTYVSDHLDRE